MDLETCQHFFVYAETTASTFPLASKASMIRQLGTVTDEREPTRYQAVSDLRTIHSHQFVELNKRLTFVRDQSQCIANTVDIWLVPCRLARTCCDYHRRRMCNGAVGHHRQRDNMRLRKPAKDKQGGCAQSQVSARTQWSATWRESTARRPRCLQGKPIAPSAGLGAVRYTLAQRSNCTLGEVYHTGVCLPCLAYMTFSALMP
jgi:hypothetical protein